MIKLKDLLRVMYVVNHPKAIKVAYKCESFLVGHDDINFLMDKQVRAIEILYSVIFIRLKEEGIDDVFEIEL